MKTAAFFDLDGTLLGANSGALWMRRERRLGRIDWRQLAQGTFFLVAYRFKVIDMDHVTRKALETVRGLPVEEVERWTREWFFEEVVAHALPGGFRAIQRHRLAGHRLVLLTTSSPFEAELAREFFGLDACLSTRYETSLGKLTGDFVAPLCYGAGKIIHAERYSDANGIDLGASHYYADSISDLPMLERVGHPHVVSPDLRLRFAARRRGWPLIDWSL